MSLSSQISLFATRLGTDMKSVIANVGTLTDLSTTAQTSLVAAINEVKTTVDSMSTSLGATIDDSATNTSQTWSSSQINTAITDAINALVNGAPEAMDTLKELADAIEENGDAISALETIAAGHVRFNEAQSLTDEQKAQARTNIDAVSQAELTAAVAAVDLSGYLTSTDAAATYATLTALATTDANVSTNTTDISTLTTNVGDTTTDFVAVYEAALV